MMMSGSLRFATEECECLGRVDKVLAFWTGLVEIGLEGDAQSTVALGNRLHARPRQMT